MNNMDRRRRRTRCRYLSGFEHDLSRVVNEHKTALGETLGSHQHRWQLDICSPGIWNLFGSKTLACNNCQIHKSLEKCEIPTIAESSLSPSPHNNPTPSKPNATNTNWLQNSFKISKPMLLEYVFCRHSFEHVFFCRHSLWDLGLLQMQFLRFGYILLDTRFEFCFQCTGSSISIDFKACDLSSTSTHTHSSLHKLVHEILTWI